MPFTLPEALEDLPALLTLVQAVEAGIKALPPTPTFSDDAKLIASLLPQLGTLVDTIKAQIAS